MKTKKTLKTFHRFLDLLSFTNISLNPSQGGESLKCKNVFPVNQLRFLERQWNERT